MIAALALAAVPARAVSAAMEVGSAAAVRRAVQELAKDYGPRFPRGAEFLRRLDSAGQDQESLAGLRREVLLAHPLLREHPLVFVARRQYRKDHHNTETFFQKGEINTHSYEPPGVLMRLDVASGRVESIVDGGATAEVRDPEVSFDGRKILFSMRKSMDDGWHIYEVGADGSGLRQLTRAAEVCDIDPMYLPDGAIIFTSTREPKYCMCNRHIMGNLFRMEGDGANIHQIGRSTLFEGHASLMPDGRVMYDRWEYIDRNFGDGQALWTVNPDGTAHSIFWGSNLGSPGGVIDGRMLPGEPLTLAIFCACHDRPWGALALVDRRQGVNTRESLLQTWPASATNLFGRGGFDSYGGVAPKFEDPFPLDDHFFLVSRQLVADRSDERMGIFLVDRFGNEVLVHAEGPGCFDPMPLAPRAKPPVIPVRRKYDRSPGTFFVENVYQGTSMQSVPRGSVKFLRVVESPEKRFFSPVAWGGQGAQAPAMNWHNFENKRILGTVPVEADGSANFEVPPDTYVFFQLLDENGMMIQSMRSGTIIQPGESQGCVGCHDERTTSSGPPRHNVLAMQRAPSRLDGWHGASRLFSFTQEVQPVLTKYCVSCHDFGKTDKNKIVLAADRDVFFNAAYEELWAKHSIKCVGGGPPDIQPPMSWGSHASKLIELVRTNHAEVKLGAEEVDRLITWVDLNAPYYPSYASVFPGNLAGRSPLTTPQIARLAELTGVDLRKHDSHSSLTQALVSFDRPELSPILAKMDNSGAAFHEALEIIRAGAKALAETPREDMPDCALKGIDVARNERYLRCANEAEASLAAIREGRKHYDAGRSD